MVKILGTICFLLVFLLVGTLITCEEEVSPYEDFFIPKGKHEPVGVRVQSLQSSSLKFTAIFDHSAIYQTELAENQHDINKLMGFSDCNSHHHDNSARFGWRWLNGNLEIHAYAYVNSERVTQLIGTITLDSPHEFEIRLTNESYIFDMQGYDSVEIDRNKMCEKGLYYMLFPYFGGDEVAPHDILIRITVLY